ncbi:MAG: AsmA-like C-terminal domain-containing protein [Thermodesulfobacteriota bacterium]
MIPRKRRSFLWILIPILIVGVLGFLFIHYVFNPDLYKKILQESLTTHLGREVSIGKAKISLWGGIGMAFEDLRVKDRSLTFDLLQSKRVILKVKLLPLLKREVQWKRIVLDGPVLRLIKDEKGHFNFFDGPLAVKEFKPSQQKMIQTLSTLFGGSLTLRNGVISFSDESLGSSPLITEIRSFNLQFSRISYRKSFPFRLNGEIHRSPKKGRFSMVGTIQNIPEDMDLSKGKTEMDVEIKGIDVFHFWPYLKTLLPMETISGLLDLKAHYQGDFSGAFKTSAKFKFKEVFFDYRKVFSYILKPKWVNIDLDMAYDLKDVTVPRISIEMPEIWIKAKGKISAIGSEGMCIEAEAQSGPFDLSEGRKFIPYRIITPEVSDSLFRAEGSGPVQILSVKLSGKMPEIDHCDQPQNSHVLSVEMKVDKARLKLPWNLPPLEDLKGHLIFKEGDLYLKEIEGRIFHSSIDRANGIFHQLLLVPTLQIHCEGRMDLIDLPAFATIEGLSNDLSRIFSPIRILSGRSQYRLSAKGLLKPPIRFEHQGTYHISKARFTHRQIPFPVSIGEGRIELSNDEFQWSGAKVEFGNSSLLLNGSWKKKEKTEPVEIRGKGRVDFKILFSLFQSQLFPEEIRSKIKGVEGLSGTGELAFKGRLPKGIQLLSYEGKLMSKGVHLFLKGISSPLIFKEGTLSFSNLGVGFSKAKIQSESFSLTLDGLIKEGNLNLSTWGSIDLKYLHSLLQSPLLSDRMRSQIDGIQKLAGGAEVRLKWLGRMAEWTTALKEGEIRLKGVSLQHSKIPVPLFQIEGSFLLSSEQVRFDGLKGKMGDSPLTVSGAISRTSSSYSPHRSSKAGEPSPESGRGLSLQIYSPQLDLDPFFPKKEKTIPTSFEKMKDWLSKWSFDGKVNIDQGRIRGFDFQGLKAEMKTVEGKLLFRPFQFKADGGDLWGEGWVQPTERGIRFEIKPRLSNMEAKAFLRTIFQKGKEEKVMVTGRVHINKVELRGEGEDFQKVKESLNGGLRLELENGVIERFNILAKIFSILNVSQLLRGRFPDLATKGLPYHQIIGNLHVKDGIASTEDLVLDSDAMRITFFGKVDLGKNLIDAKIGIHPLVTIDMVLSNVPVAGYILTGKDKAFLSYVYEVKGNLDDPKIEAIPIKSLGGGFIGIVKRLLETPLRPFQKSPSTDK